MTDFGRKLAEKFEDARDSAQLSNDQWGFHVFSYSERLVRVLTDEAPFPVPDEETVGLVESAIIKQRKWSPDEVKPKWGMALSILNDEKISLRLGR